MTHPMRLEIGGRCAYTFIYGTVMGLAVRAVRNTDARKSGSKTRRTTIFGRAATRWFFVFTGDALHFVTLYTRFQQDGHEIAIVEMF